MSQKLETHNRLKAGEFEEEFAKGSNLSHLWRTRMGKAVLGARIVLGLIFAVFGLLGLFQLIPPPPEMPEAVRAFTDGMMATKYLFPLIKLTESICGIMLLANFFSPLALVVLAPISLNIFLFHAFTSPEGLPIAVLILILHVFLGVKNMDKYRPMFTKM